MKKYLILLFLFLTAACRAEEIKLTENDAGKEVAVKAGDKIAVILPANPTTGYAWNFAVEAEKNSFTAVEESYRQDKAEKGMVGVGGMSKFVFVILQNGKFAVTARYYRPWEEFDPQTDKEIRIVIEAK